jgi:NADH:ubiquinone oxidoreductase subunit 2 (subunit N)
MAYYLPVVATIWRGETQPGPDAATGFPVLAGGAPEADVAHDRAGWELTLAGVVLTAAVLVFGIVPQPVFNLVASAARGLGLS